MALYVRPLSPEEREQVEALARSRDAITYRRGRILLLSAQGKGVAAIVQALGHTDRWVREVIRRFNRGGLSGVARRKAPGKARLCDAATQEALIELLHQSPLNFGIESELWTPEELAAVAVQQGLVAAISERTVRREMQRAGHSWQRAKRWTKNPDPAYAKKRADKANHGAGAC
jgi:transposase